jgi:hypothetical protein
MVGNKQVMNAGTEDLRKLTIGSRPRPVKIEVSQTQEESFF